ncbi:HAMP domain-containing histidine kinase [Aliarcobacter cryaerophilus]|uniref:sensor histidine kinase n=1 Tax=Aliarcobacter cryaerophilus TaxID=28198 RepID=UPI0021B5A78F|nr:HAMP domain-containing sensor histidine kinase [Aliarcobacter cryaerophilus]MCT7524423.1 HAMP domain-containing histidine kinase [Aliarcobacter cryaerophilus]
MPKSSTFLFIIIIFFLLFSFASYQLLYKNISDNHKKNQEIVFYQIQKDTSSFLSKLLFKFSKEKEPLFQKHKEVLKYLEKNSFDVSLDEIYEKINKNLSNKPYNIYITDDNLVIKNTTLPSDLNFDLSFAKYLFDNHKQNNIIGVSPPIFEMFSQKMISYTDSYLANSNRVLQVSYTYDDLDKDLEDLKKIINENINILNANAYIVFNDGYIGDFIFKNIKSYKPTLKEIEQRIEKGRDIFYSFEQTPKYFKQNDENKTYFLLEHSPIFDEAKIVYSIVFDENDFNKHIFILNLSFFILSILGVVTIYIIYKVREKEYILNYKDKFIEHSIHEIKTPLSIISLNLQLKNENIGVDKYSKKIEGALRTLINSYEDMSFLHIKSKIMYKIENLNLKNLLENRMKYFELIAQTQNRVLSLEILNDFFIDISEIELERFIDNNISNAIKYSEVNSTIKIILENNILKFISLGDEIKDKKAIFIRYIRENKSLGGHGIGLSIVKDICDKYNIKIEVISKNGENIFLYTFLPQISHTNKVK